MLLAAIIFIACWLSFWAGFIYSAVLAANGRDRR